MLKRLTSPKTKILLLLILTPLCVFGQSGSVWQNPIKECWVYSTENLTKFGFASDNEKTIFLPFSDGSLHALDRKSGARLWTLDLGGSLNSPVFVNNRSLYFTRSVDFPGEKTTSIVSVDLTSGVNNWKTRLTKNESDFSLDSSAGILYAANSSGNIVAFNKLTRKSAWEKSIDGPITSNTVIGPTEIIIGTGRKMLLVFSKTDGHLIDTIPLRGIPTKLLLINDRELIVGDKWGNLVRLDLERKKEKWKIKTGGQIVGLSLNGNRALVFSNDNYAYYVSLSSGRKVWKRRLSGRMIGQVVIENRIGVFLSSGSNVGILVDLTNGGIVNRVSIEDNQHFTSGPDFIGNTLLLPTNKGLKALSPTGCTN